MVRKTPYRPNLPARVVTLVRDGSPMTNANTLAGDVTIPFDKDQLESPEQESELLYKYSGHLVGVTYVRNVEAKKVSVQFKVRPTKNEAAIGRNCPVGTEV